jgi:galactokinase
MRQEDVQEGLKLVAEHLPRKVSKLGFPIEPTSFREYSDIDLVEAMGALPEGLRRRCLHIVNELHRIDEAEEALVHRDLATLSKTILHSHESLRDLYEVSCPEVDWLVKRAGEIEGVVGARMTGSGFGGCTYTIIPDEAVEEYKDRFDDYERIFSFHPLIYETRLATAAHIIEAK